MNVQPPIGDYAFIGDCHSAALVSRDGSVDWCCFGRFDARPVFARILDPDRGGWFRVAPAGRYDVSRRYLPGTNVLETTFETAQGRLVLTDLIPIPKRAPEGGARQVIRIARCDEGEVEVLVEFSPRFDYGTTLPRLQLLDEGLGRVFGGADGLVFQSEVPLARTDLCSCAGSAVLRAGERASFVVTHRPPQHLEAQRERPRRIERLLDETIDFWREWSDRCTYEGRYRDEVVRSALVVKGLTDAGTGAIVAAATTSLPEEIGGVRNWDYRFSWLRDAALDLYALFRLGYTDEAHAFTAWLVRTTAGHVEELQPLYGVGGEHLIVEMELPTLAGYRGSRPVRIGNAAASQFQLDIFGELLDTAWLYHRHGGELDPIFWDLLLGVVDLVEARWEQPDRGIWEVRGESEQFVSSKIMAWVAVDRAIKLAWKLGLAGDVSRWRRLRREIRDRVLADGVHPETGALVRTFGSRDADASTLLAPLVRFLSPDDPRVRATIDFVEAELADDAGFVRRYVAPDGIEGRDGAFLICSFWLVDNLALTGDVTRARKLFEDLCGMTNDVGLFAEQIDPVTREHLGNFPQTFSHVGLIGAALNLEKAPGTSAEVVGR